MLHSLSSKFGTIAKTDRGLKHTTSKAHFDPVAEPQQHLSLAYVSSFHGKHLSTWGARGRAAAAELYKLDILPKQRSSGLDRPRFADSSAFIAIISLVRSIELIPKDR